MKATISLLIATGISFVVAVIIWAVFMHTETVEPGYHGVIVDKPYLWGHEGVRDEPLKEGRILLFRSSSVTPVRMTPQSVRVKFDDFSSQDNILLDFESTIQFQVTAAPYLVGNFGEGWFDNNIGAQYAAIVREAIKKKTMPQMMSDVASAAEVDKEVTDALVKLVAESKLPIRIIGVSLGRAQPNTTVLAQMNETATQQQRKRSLIEATAAEGEREKEQVARAKADNAYRNAMGLSPELFIQLESIKRYSEVCRESKNCIVTPGQSNIMIPTK